MIRRVTPTRGSSWEFTYNSAQELLRGAAFQTFAFAYDASGNRTSASVPPSALGGSGANSVPVSLAYQANRDHQYTAIGSTLSSIPWVMHPVRIQGQVNRSRPSLLEIRADGEPVWTQNLAPSAQNAFEAEFALQNLSGQPRTVALTITGTLPGAGHDGRNAVARLERSVTVPPLDALTRGSVTDLAYDADGNLVSDGSWLYTWNGRNELASMCRPASWIQAGNPEEVLTFAYNAEGMRTFKGYRRVAADGATTTRTHKFVYDGTTLLVEAISPTIIPLDCSIAVPRTSRHRQMQRMLWPVSWAMR